MKSLRANYVGGGNSLVVYEQSVPEHGPDDILLRVKACAVNLTHEKKYHELMSASLKSCPVGTDVAGDIVTIGSNVEQFQEGMAVVGVLPLDAPAGGCGEICVINQFDIVEKPNSLSYEKAAATIGAGLAAYTAIHYLGHVTAGDTVLVVGGGTPQGSLMVQAAHAWGAKVMSTYKTHSEKQLLEALRPPVAQAIELTQRTNILASAVMEETGGVGVNCVIDSGVRLFTYEDDKDLMDERILKSVPHKNDIIACLGFAGKWITSQSNLQLDPPDSQQLFLRGATLSFLFPPAWTLMKAQHGCFQHVLRDVIGRIQNEEFRCNEVMTIPLSEAPEKLLQHDLDSTKCLVIIP